MRPEDNAEEQEQSALLSLPNELLEQIISYLDYQSVARLGSANTRLHIATQQRRLADKALNLQCKKRYLKAFALYGACLKNVEFFPRIIDVHGPVDWIKRYNALPENSRCASLLRDRFKQYRPELDIPLLKNTYPELVGLIKRSKKDPAVLLPVREQLKAIRIQSITDYKLLLDYMVRSACQSGGGLLMQNLLDVDLDLYLYLYASSDLLLWIAMAAISSCGRSLKEQTVCENFIATLKPRCALYSYDHHAIRPQLPCILKTLAAQGNLEMYRTVIGAISSYGEKRFYDNAPTLGYLAVQTAIAYGHVEFVRHLISKGAVASAPWSIRWVEWGPHPHGILVAVKHKHRQIAYFVSGIDEQTPDNCLTPLDQIKKRFLEYLFRHPEELEQEYIQALVERVFSYREMRLKQDWEEPLRTGELGTLYQELSQYYSQDYYYYDFPKMNILARAYRSLQYWSEGLVPYTEYPPFEFAMLLYSPFIIILSPSFRALMLLAAEIVEHQNFLPLNSYAFRGRGIGTLYPPIWFLQVIAIIIPGICWLTLFGVTVIAVLVTGLFLFLGVELCRSVGRTVSEWWCSNASFFSSRFLACFPTSSALKPDGLSY